MTHALPPPAVQNSPAASSGATICLLSTSPRPHGSTDTACDLLAHNLPSTFVRETIRLRETHVRPCVGCGFCTAHPDSCPLDTDDTPNLFSTIKRADALILTVPVYFYGPPAVFKGFIDRAQRFWALQEEAPRRPAYALLCAARSRGERLFEANLLILRCFLNSLHFDLQPPLLLRGVEEPHDLHTDSIRAQIAALAQEAAAGATRFAQRQPLSAPITQ